MGVDSLNRVGAQTGGGCLPQLRLAGCRCGTAHLRGPSGGGHRGLVRPERAARRRLLGKVSLRISWSISLSRSERERAITKQIQDDETHSPERGIFPAAAFVREADVGQLPRRILSRLP
jgi:hypothetical protein